MSDYWKKKLGEQNNNRTSSSHTTSSTSKSYNYWKSKLGEQEQERKRKKEEEEAKRLEAERLAESIAGKSQEQMLAEGVLKFFSDSSDGRTWFQKGLFEDGYDWGDITKTWAASNKDISTDFLAGGVNKVENVIDFGASKVGEVGAFFGAKDFSNSVNDFIKKDIIPEDEVASFLNAGIGSKVANIIMHGEDYESMSLWGDKSDSLAKSAGGMAVTAGLQYAGVPWQATTAVTVYGEELENALNNGASTGEANFSAAVSAGAEVLTGSLFKIPGLASTGSGKVGQGIVGKLTKNISNTAVKNLINYGVNIFGEGFEEVGTSFFQRLGQVLSYEREDTLKELAENEEARSSYVSQVIDKLFGKEAQEEYGEAFIGGSVMAGFGGAPATYEATKAGRDINTGLNTDEQTVLDKAVEEVIKQEEAKSGKKLTTRQKIAIEKKVQSYMDDGRISADFIESVLGGEAYTNFKGAKDAFEGTDDYKAYERAKADKNSLPALEDELAELGKQPNTVENNKKYDALSQRIEAIKNGTELGELETKLSPEASRIVSMRDAVRRDVYSRVKDSRLAESYRELVRSKQKLDMDASKYTNETARRVVQHIVDSQLMDNTNQSKRTVEFLAKLASDKGLDIEALSNEAISKARKAPKGTTIHGYISSDGKMTLNMESPRVLQTTAGHEITHVFEGTELYNELSKVAKDYCITKEGLDKYNARIKEAEDLYSGDENTTPEGEVVADLIGEYLFTDEEFINNLAANKNVFQRVYDEVKYLYKIAVAGSREQRQLEKVKRAFDRVYQQTVKFEGKSDGKAQSSKSSPNFNEYEWSIVNRRKYSEFGNPKYDLDNDTKWMYANEKGHTVFAIYSKADADDPTVMYGSSGSKAESDYATLNAYIRGELNVEQSRTKPNRRTLNAILADIESTKRSESAGIPSVAERGSAVGNVSIPLEERERNSGRNLGDGTQDSRVTETTEYNDEASGDPGASFVTFSNDYQYFRNRMKEGDVGEEADSDVKYSMSKDSDGNELTKAQQDFFKDSKVRDENGNLKPVYHGTYEDFSVFDISKTSVTNAFGAGHYFTSKQSDAQNNYASSEGADVRTKIESLAWHYFEEMGYSEADYESNDYVEEWNEAYDKAEAFYESGKVMQVYLNITNPLYAGRHGELYNSAGEEVTARSAEILKELGYDGIVDYGVSDRFSRFQDLDEDTAHYVVFDSNQIKLTDNQSPTSSQDIRFSMSKAVEETKDLVALHNLTQDKLLKSLQLGGLPMPSIAITKAEIPHENFGEITLILGKDSIDPKANKKNVVYSADAWTPVFPRVEYEPDAKVEKQVNKKLLDLAIKVDDVFKHDLDTLRYSHEDNLNRYGGEEGYIQYVMDKYGVKAAYLEDKGIHIDKITQQIEESKKFNPANAEKYQKVMDILGVYTADEIGKVNLKEARDQHGTELETVYPGITQSAMRMGAVFNMVKSYLADKDSGPVYRTVTDEAAMRKAVDDALDAEGYETWVRNLFQGIEGNSGIYNNKDIFTPSGNRRSFNQTHLPFTLENIVKAMASQNGGNTKNIAGFNGVKTLRAGTAERFKSIQAMHERKGRLQNLTEEEFQQIHDELQTRLFGIIETIDNETNTLGERNSFIRFDAIGEILMEISEGGKYNVADIQSVFAKYNRNIGDDLATEIKQMLFDVAQMPVNIYEAKPERAVSFDEVGVFVIPRNADSKLKQELLNNGYSIAEYDPDVEGDRHKVVNQFEEYRFSLTPEGKENTPFGYKSAKELAYNKENTLDDLADLLPIRDDINTTAPANNVDESDTWRESFEAINDDDAPPIVDNSPVKEISTVAERLQQKIDNTQAELDKNRELRIQSAQYYDEEIARLQEKYDSKRNKNSKVAQSLLRSIERLKRLKGNIDADYEKRISDLEARVEKMNSPEYRTAEQRRAKMQEHTDFWEATLGDTSTWKDLALGLAYKTKTLRRILRKVVKDANGKPDIAKADEIYDALETRYDHHEAQLKKESAKLKEVFKNLKLNHAEDTYAHMLGEFRHNPQTTLTEDAVKEFYEKNKGKIDKNKVERAIAEARDTFDKLLVRVNEVLKEQGMKEIPYRKGYFPHFTNPKQGWLAKLLNWKTIDTEIPTSIAGLTEQFDPQRSWQGFNKQRKGDTTDYSLYQGLDTYIHGALDWIYHIDDLQSRRALENHIRYIHSEEGVKARIDEIKANEYLDADATQTAIEAVLAEASNPLNNLVTELRARTNTLANKKASMDRGMEEATNRKIYSTMTNLNNRINANMVVGSFSSALTNFIPMVQSWHQVSPYFTVRGLGDFIRSTVHDDGMVAKSDFLTNRLIEEEKLYQTAWDKVSDKAAFMMNVIDSITSQTVWRSKYLQNMKEGMSESEAIKDADQFAKNLIAGRSRGNMPTIFDAKNPLIKVATAFQLEVANQYGFMFEDTPQDTKSKARLVKGYATAFMGAYLYNSLYSSLVGRDAAFDPISIIEDLFGDLFGDDEEEPEDIVLNLVDNILDELPYVSGFTGGGRIPISSAMPYEGDYESFISDAFNGEIKAKEMLKPLYYLAMPVGGGQLKKTVEGLSMFDDDLPITGSYTDSGALRFPVEKTFGNVAQAALFGQYASKNAREYFDNGYAPLEEKQIQEYKDLDIPIRDYWEYREGLKGLTKAEEKADYIDSLDLPISKKNILINNQLDRKEQVDMADYGEYDSLAEFDFANENPEKYDFFNSIGVSYQDYANADDKGKDTYNWAYNNPGKYTVSKAVTSDLFEYRQYTSDLGDIRADKDSNGKTINGSAKKKKVAYINGLNIDYGAKLILFKDAYPSDDTYNQEIVDYLNGNDDLTYEDRVTILSELGFTVKNGKVYWD